MGISITHNNPTFLKKVAPKTTFKKVAPKTTFKKVAPNNKTCLVNNLHSINHIRD